MPIEKQDLYNIFEQYKNVLIWKKHVDYKPRASGSDQYDVYYYGYWPAKKDVAGGGNWTYCIRVHYDPYQFYLYNNIEGTSEYEVLLLNKILRNTEVILRDHVTGDDLSDVVENLSGGKISDHMLPKTMEEYKEEVRPDSDKPEPLFKTDNNENVYFYERLTQRKTNDNPARAIEFYILDNTLTSCIISAMKTNLEMGETKGPFTQKQDGDNNLLSYADALSMVQEKIKQAKNNKFVDESHYAYIPKGSDRSNWDFETNTPKESYQDQFGHEDQKFVEFDDFGVDELEADSILNKLVFSQSDYSQYFSGDVPEYAGELVGNQMVDVTSLSGVFPRVNDVITLVNAYDSSLLKNISFIFNSSDAGSFGVYIPALDREVKTKALEKMLEGRGYDVQEVDGVPTAFPSQEEKTQEEVGQEIDSLYQNLESEGGTIFGVNILKDIQSAKESANNIERPDLWEELALIHVGATIVHEATHAKGYMEESTPEQNEQAFFNWALQKLQNEGVIDTENDIMIRPASNKSNWYKTAQFLGAFPGNKNINRGPVGSDLQGRMNPDYTRHPGAASWGLMWNMNAGTHIEQKLGRQYMSPLPSGLSQEHDHIELQLRKGGGESENKAMTLEELLYESHSDEEEAYDLTEEQMENHRVAPLMVPIQQEAALQKEATLFGWMNNLEISDGSTIPGLSDRVMAWDDRDESFAEQEDWIKKQPRYNPEYDNKGFYYRYIEPRYAPRLFKDITRDFTNIHPARRFASTSETLDEGTVQLMSVLADVRKKIDSGEIKATRFVASGDIMPVIVSSFSNFKVVDPIEVDDDIFAIWVCQNDVDADEVDKIEKYMAGEDVDEAPDLQSLLGRTETSNIIHDIIEEAKNVCQNYQIYNLFVIGEAARMWTGENCIGSFGPWEIDFSINSADNGLKIAEELAERLGVGSLYCRPETKSAMFSYKGIRVDFSGKYKPEEITEMMDKYGLDCSEQVLVDLCNRDIIDNMVAVNVMTDDVVQPFGESDTIKTLFDADKIIQMNPVIALRIIIMHLQTGKPLADEVEEAIIKNSATIKKMSEKYRNINTLVGRIKNIGGEEALKDVNLL